MSVPALDYRRMFEQSPGLILVLAPDRPRFTILAVTDAYARATRTARETIVGRGLFEVFPDNPEDPAADGVRNLAASLGTAIDTRAAHRMDVQRYDIQVPGDGFEAHWWSPINVPIVGPDGAIACLLHRVEDVSELVLKNTELDMQRARAEAASAAKSEFLSSMSHELRTPLNAILGFAQLLGRDRLAPLAPRHVERVQHIVKAAEHLVHLVDDVLDLSHIEAGRVTVSPEPIALPALLEEVRVVLSPMARDRDVALAVAPLPELPPALADRTRLAQILVNFGTNAIKYNRPGGHVTVRAAARAAGVRIAVEDDGLGIAPAHQATVFEPFERGGQDAGPIEGTGIGLAIARQLATLMGGSVGFASELGEGSTFWVDLPRASAYAIATHARPAAEVRAPRGGAPLVVVYVEDNPANVAFMRDALSEVPNLTLLTAPSAELGVPLIRERRPDVVLMDINLPGASGLEAAKQLAAWPETADIPIIALTAAVTSADRKAAAAAGFRRYFTKPVQLDALLAAIDELASARARPA